MLFQHLAAKFENDLDYLETFKDIDGKTFLELPSEFFRIWEVPVSIKAKIMTYIKQLNGK